MKIIELEHEIDITQDKGGQYNKEYWGNLVVSKSSSQSAVFSKDGKLVFWLTQWVIDLIFEEIPPKTSSEIQSSTELTIPANNLVTPSELINLKSVFSVEEIMTLKKEGLI